MPRIRTIKPEFFTSPDTAKVSHAARLLYIAMWCWADDHGRGELNLLQLRAFTFPEHDPWLENTFANKNTEVQSEHTEFQNLCAEVINGYNITTYTNNGRTYYEIPSWDHHQKLQRRAKPKHPGPNDPQSAPDQRFQNTHTKRNKTHVFSESTHGSSETTRGKSPTGTGEQGTGNIGGGDVVTVVQGEKSYPQVVENDNKPFG